MKNSNTSEGFSLEEKANFIDQENYLKNNQQLDLKLLIKYAVKAPSGHNTQPWKFFLGNNEIQIHPDFSRALPVVDADNHALYISLGCAAENIKISANNFGYDSDINLQKLNNEINFISIKFIKNESLQIDELFNEIETRQSTRKEYSSKPVPAYDLEKLKMSFNLKNIDLLFFLTPAEINSLLPLIIEGSNLQFHNKKFVEELTKWFRFTEKEAKEKNDGLWTACLGLPKMNHFIGNLVMKNFVTAKSEAKRWKKLIESSAGLAMFVAKENNIESWINLGRAFQRFALTATKLQISHAHVNMPCEELPVREKIKEQYDLGPSHPLLLIRFGYSEKMPYSFRKSSDKVIFEK